MSFGTLIFLAFLALMVFGPQRLPEIARTVAKLMAELRRASNEFRYSLEEEIRSLDLQEQEKKRLAAAPIPAVPGSVAQSAPRISEEAARHAAAQPEPAPELEVQEAHEAPKADAPEPTREEVVSPST